MQKSSTSAFLWMVAALTLAACDVVVAEVERIASPDGKVELVISTTDGGATTSVGYQVNLVAPGAKPDLDASVFVADEVAGISAHWASLNKVVIQCGDARVFHFTNFWQSRDADNFRHIVQISLTGCAD